MDEKENNKTENNSDDKDKMPNVVENEWMKKLVFALCYIWGILFFLPLILYKDDETAKFHANQGLVLLLFTVIGNAILNCLTLFGGFLIALFAMISYIYSILLLILGIFGIVNVVTDKNQALPVIGKIQIIK